MTNLSVFEREGFSIRSTGDGRFSVFDVMVAFEVTDKRHASQVLKSIVERLPEVHHLTVNFKFPGKGQRVTPGIGDRVGSLVSLERGGKPNERL